MREIFVEKREELIRIAVKENDELVECLVEEKTIEPQIGEVYKARVKNIIPAINSIFLDIGYGKDRYEFKYVENENRIVENFRLNNISIGLLPRINFGFLSIGIGGGVKFPISMTYSIDNKKYKLDLGDIRDTLNNFYYPYIKASVDFLIKGKNKFMMTLGVYANYDFPFNLKNNGMLKDIAYSKENIASFDIGFQIGLYLISL